MKRWIYFFALLFITSIIMSCADDNPIAPVVNAWHQAKASSSLYHVQKGDTIYSIAWAFGLDYRALAAANDLQPPYVLSPGEDLKMVPTPHQSSSKVTIHETQLVPPSQSIWYWPAKGRLVERFTARMTGSQGIGISGKIGQSIHATSAGEVVYSGDGVRGYGNLIIVKHNSNYLSAYAFNQQNLVQVGDFVKANQVIARMGKNDAGRTLLYFEIRYKGKPVDPLLFLR